MSRPINFDANAHAAHVAKLKLSKEARDAAIAAKRESRRSFRRFLGVVALASGMVFAGVYALASGHYDAVTVDASGDAHVMDYNLSAYDCLTLALQGEARCE